MKSQMLMILFPPKKSFKVLPPLLSKDVRRYREHYFKIWFCLLRNKTVWAKEKDLDKKCATLMKVKKTGEEERI